MTFDLGYLEYPQSDTGSSLAMIIVIAVIIGTVFLTIAIIVIFVIVRVVRSKRRVDRDLRILQRQMETESKCRQRPLRKW